MPPAGVEPAIPVSERPQSYALNRTATEIGQHLHAAKEVRLFQIFKKPMCNTS
jgi:hypothetical protein